MKKPVVAWVIGACAAWVPAQAQLFHAGARTRTLEESAQEKNNALKEAGVLVPESFSGLGESIASVYQKLVQKGTIFPQPDIRESHIKLLTYTQFLHLFLKHFSKQIKQDLYEDPLE